MKAERKGTGNITGLLGKASPSGIVCIRSSKVKRKGLLSGRGAAAGLYDHARSGPIYLSTLTLEGRA